MTKEIATIYKVGEVTERQGRDRTFRNQEIIIEVQVNETSFRRVALRVDDRLIDDVAKYREGDKVNVMYVVRAREWQGRYFNNVDLVRIDPFEPVSSAEIGPKTQAAAAHAKKVATPAPAESGSLEPQNDDLPF